MVIVNNMGNNGEILKDTHIVEKILRILTKKFNYFVVSIEEFKGITTLTVDELQSSLIFECPEWGKRANFAKMDEDEELLLMAYIESRRASIEEVWFFDSGCSNHMSGNKDWFTELDKNFKHTVKLGNDSRINVTRSSNVRMKANGITQVITSVYYIPELKINLFSVGQLQENRLAVLIQNNMCKVFHSRRGVIMHAEMSGNRMFYFKAAMESNSSNCYQTRVEDEAQLWHSWFGHLHYKALRALADNGRVEGMPTIKHSGIMFTFPGGKTWIYMLNEKSEAFIKFKNFKNLIEKEAGISIQCLRTHKDNDIDEVGEEARDPNNLIVLGSNMNVDNSPPNTQSILSCHTNERRTSERHRRDLVWFSDYVLGDNLSDEEEAAMVVQSMMKEFRRKSFVQQPVGFEMKGAKDKVYKLNKELYVMRQASQAWYSRIESYFIKECFKRCSSEHTLFTKEKEGGDENRLEQGDAYLPVIVGVSCDLRELQSFIEGHTAKGVGLRVADSDTGNHLEDDFMPLKLFKASFRKLVVDYDIPQDVRVKLSKRNQTIFDAPLGFVGLYTHSFTLSNLRIPLLKFFSEVLNYFKVHISRLNPFGLAKLMTFEVMCKAYGGEPCIELLRAFLNLGHARNWMTLSNIGETNIPRAITKPFTYIEGWKGSFFYIENKIVPFEYPELLLEDNKLDKKSLKDVIPRHILKMRKENMADLDDTPSEKDEVVLIDLSVAEKAKNQKVSASSKVASKRKQTASESSGRETRQKTRKVPPQASKAAGEHFDPLDFDIFPSAKELKDFADCHWVVAHVVLDNFMNRRTHELLSTLSEARVAYDAIREREKEKDKAYAKLEAKCNDPQQDLEKNPPILDLRVEIRTLQG
ncbi:retrovirus-related pol polyprotein from transposon TNT 1-94 [Tanacetum coccineum]